MGWQECARGLLGAWARLWKQSTGLDIDDSKTEDRHCSYGDFTMADGRRQPMTTEAGAAGCDSVLPGLSRSHVLDWRGPAARKDPIQS